MPSQRSAATLLSPGQKILGLVLAMLALTEVLVFGPVALLRTVVVFITAFYVVFVGFKVLLWWAATHAKDPDLYVQLALLDDDQLPLYTILVPMLHETKETVEGLTNALWKLHYPARKLQILLLVEESDGDTRRVVEEMGLPPQFTTILIPQIGPQTKPKACTYAFQFVRGEFLTIFDAEDRPQILQLRLAATKFQALGAKVATNSVACLQARLAFWNPRVSWVATFYWGEYVVHFETVLRGLARLGLIPPLGGTSNHFRVSALKTVAEVNGGWKFTDENGQQVTIRGPWDPYNLTEDADLAWRLYGCGYRVMMLDSVTYEEAPAGLKKAKNQRSRWLQGYAQTGLVVARRPWETIRNLGPIRWFTFQLFMIGTPFSILINPITWGTTTLYIVSRLDNLPAVSTFIEGLFPTPVYYAGMLVAVFGNSLLFYQKLITPLRRQERSESLPGSSTQNYLESYLYKEEYGLSLRLLLTPLWWAFTSISAYRALRKLLTPSQRSAWDKTPHGHAAEVEREIAAGAGQLTQLTTGAIPHQTSVETIIRHPESEGDVETS